MRSEPSQRFNDTPFYAIPSRLVSDLTASGDPDSTFASHPDQSQVLTAFAETLRKDLFEKRWAKTSDDA